MISSAFGYDTPLWQSMLYGGLCFAVVYVFQAIGLFVIAQRAGYDKKWMAFVPFFNTYYIGVCGSKNKFFGIKPQTVSLIAAILEVILFAGYVLDYVALDAVDPFVRFNSQNPLDPYYLSSEFANHPELAWAGWCFEYLYDYILRWLELVFIFLSIVILNCFFQTYSARYYIIFTIACVLLPIRGIIIFIVRKNKGMSYADYTRKMQEQIYRQYRSQQNYNRDPYNQNPYNSDPYNGNPYNHDGYGGNAGSQNAGDPFSEFSSAPDDKDPFDEFKNN